MCPVVPRRGRAQRSPNALAVECRGSQPTPDPAGCRAHSGTVPVNTHDTGPTMPAETFGPLVDCAALAALLGRDDVVVVDCRFDLAAPDAGAAAYLDSHIAGARYAHLDRDLSGPPNTDSGRHPLPPPERIAAVLGGLGIGNADTVVAYDDTGGMYASRLWWMLRYLGHARVAVLDGGWSAWTAARGPVASGAETATPRPYAGTPRSDRLVLLDDVAGAACLVDARAGARYRGEVEPIDPHAGHIPGALNHCWQDNLGPDGRFLDPATLRTRWRETIGILPDAATVHYCGSGVSACHNVLAQVAAGLPEPRLYCGSWSEWCSDSGRPRAVGRESNT